MNFLSKIAFILLSSVILVQVSCKKKENFSDIPYIEFVSFAKIQTSTGVDDKGILEFSFTDGDGDIGLHNWDTVAPYDYNLFISYFEKQNGEFKEVIIVDINDDVAEAIQKTVNASKPVGALCISPALLAKVLGDVELTIGQEPGTIEQLHKLGAKHTNTSHGEVVIDTKYKIFTTPCYMLDAEITHIEEGAANIVGKMLEVM